MTPGSILLVVLGLSGLGFLVGRQRALAVAGGDSRRLHSLPSHYGTRSCCSPPYLLGCAGKLAVPAALFRRRRDPPVARLSGDRRGAGRPGRIDPAHHPRPAGPQHRGDGAEGNPDRLLTDRSGHDPRYRRLAAV
ncbi:MAG: phosphate ABC transporter permease family protein [Rhodobacter sp.]|nr:phosphate ABC transporter permease family protein [Rhodobacter sp.]